MEERDKGQRADLFAVIGQPLASEAQRFEEEGLPNARQVYKGAP